MGFAMARQKTAFTLVEIILAVLFLGIMAVIAIPRLSHSASSKQKADCLAKKIVTDLRRTRRLAISNAAVNTAGFKLSMTGSSPYTGYNIVDASIVDANSDETMDSHTIDSAVSCTGGDEFEFGPLGNLLSGSDTQLVISADEKRFTIDITSATGMVKCTEN
jgi:Tfp pilus assembly protein FimT